MIPTATPEGSHMDPDTPALPLQATRTTLAAELAEVDGLLPGSVAIRQMRCGKRRCACKDDPPALHGPYIQWTHTVAGKTVTRYLTAEQLARYQPWFDNARRVKELVSKLEIASVHALDQDEKTHKPRRKRPGQRSSTT